MSLKGRGVQFIDNPNEGEILGLKIQVQRDSAGKIISGFVVGNTLEQNKALLLLAQPNDLKSNPTLAVGIGDIILGSDLLEYRHKIRENFEKDGLKITSLDLYTLDKIKIEAHYE